MKMFENTRTQVPEDGTMLQNLYEAKPAAPVAPWPDLRQQSDPPWFEPDLIWRGLPEIDSPLAG